MGTFQSFIETKKLSIDDLTRASARIELHSREDRAKLLARASKRNRKDAEGKSYTELGLESPKTSGRPLSAAQLRSAMADKPVARKARSKILRAVNAVLTKRKEAAVDSAALFADIKPRAGKKPAEAAGKGAKK